MRKTAEQVWHTVRKYVSRLMGAKSTRVAGEHAVGRSRPPVVVADAAPAAAAAPASGAVATPAPVATPRAPPGKFSVAVLAFSNMTGDVDQEYFAEGIAEDLATQLSHSDAVFVLPCKWSFINKGQISDVKQIGRELGVRYVLAGSVRRNGAMVQISAQLADADTGKRVWYQSFDRAVTDLFEIQDRIADAVALAINPEISPVERQRIACKPIVSYQVM
jgi:TolB-like protein